MDGLGGAPSAQFLYMSLDRIGYLFNFKFQSQKGDQAKADQPMMYGIEHLVQPQSVGK